MSVVFICTGKHPVGLCQLRGYNRLLSNTAVFLCFYDAACNGNNRLLAYLKNSCFSRRWGCRTDDRLPRVKSLLHIGKTSLSNGASSLGNSCRNSLCGRNGAVLSLNLDKTRNLNTIRQVILINVCQQYLYLNMQDDSKTQSMKEATGGVLFTEHTLSWHHSSNKNKDWKSRDKKTWVVHRFKSMSCEGWGVGLKSFYLPW